MRRKDRKVVKELRAEKEEGEVCSTASVHLLETLWRKAERERMARRKGGRTSRIAGRSGEGRRNEGRREKEKRSVR